MGWINSASVPPSFFPCPFSFPFPKVFTNHSCFHEVKQYPIETSITSPLLYHINTNFQSNSLVEPCLEDEDVGGDASKLPHALDKGLPHNPEFPSKAFGNVVNCFPYGIGLVR